MAKSLNYPHIVAELERQQWAITERGLHGIAAAVTVGLNVKNYPDFHAMPEDQIFSLASYLGDQVSDTRLTRTAGNVGSLVINGPIVPRASALLESSGIVSIDRLTSEFKALESDASIDTILLVWDSPGGAVTGVSEFASLVKSSKKRVISYAYGMAASAAYWIASAADEFYAADTGLPGSIGVVQTLRIGSDSSVVVTTNSLSPNKRIDPSTEAGVAEVVKLLDQIADVFISTVATNRGVSKAKVISDFGKGAIVGAEAAKTAGMIDGIKTLQQLTAELAEQQLAISMPSALDTQRKDNYDKQRMGTKPQEKKNMPSLMELAAEHPNLRVELEAMKDAARAEGVANEAGRYAKMLAAAKPVLESNTFPPSMKSMAMEVLEGKEELAALRGALAAIDAMRAEAEANAAVQDSNDVDPVSAAKPDQGQASVDGVLRSIADVDAELAELQRELK